MADKLSIYNLALGHLGQRRIASLSEAREPRRVLDDFWNQVQGLCLEEAAWNWFLRVVQMDASQSVTPAFGFAYAFPLPTDWVRTKRVSTVETFNPPDFDYKEEPGYIYHNFTPLYLEYVSNNAEYGTNLGAWPATFTAWVAFKLAEYACFRITGSDRLLEGEKGIIKRGHRAKIKAKANDALNTPPGQPPSGTWVRSRRGFLRGVPLPGGTQYDD